jgi:hypothetical protein
MKQKEEWAMGYQQSKEAETGKYISENQEAFLAGFEFAKKLLFEKRTFGVVVVADIKNLGEQEVE